MIPIPESKDGVSEFFAMLRLFVQSGLRAFNLRPPMICNPFIYIPEQN